MKKRIFSVILSLSMLLSLLPVGAFAATWTEGVPIVSLSSTGLNNDEIKVVLTVSSSTVAPGAFDFGVTFDSNLVEPDKAKGDVEVFEAEEAVGISTTASLSDSVTYNYKKNNKDMFYVADTKTKGFGKSGFTFTFFFKVKDAAKLTGGSAVFTLDSDVYNLTDVSGDNSATYPTSDNSVTVTIPTSSVELSGSVTTPTNGGADASSVTGTGVDAAVTWSPELVDNKFQDNTAYTATVKVTPATGYVFADAVTISGLSGYTFTKQTDGSYQATKTFEKTAKNASVPTTVTVADNTVAVPTATAKTANVTMSATVTDQYGDTMSEQAVTWSIDSAPTGVSVDATTGVVTVKNTASAGDVTVKAACGEKSDTATLEITKADPVATTVTVSGDSSNITIPSDGSTTTREFTATVYDQYGNAMNGQEVTWGMGVDSGVSLENPNGSTIQVNVTKDAAKNITTSREYTLSASVGDATGNIAFNIVRADAVATSIKVFCGSTELTDSDTVIIPTSSTDNTYTYTAKVYDQYDTEMSDKTATLTFETADSYVTFANNTVTVKKDATKDNTYTLTASYTGLTSKVITLTAKDIEITNPTVTPASATYGMTWAQIVPTTAISGGSASVAGTSVPGTFTLKETGTPPAGEDQAFTLVFNSTNGAYQNIEVTDSNYKVTVAPKDITATVTDASKTYGAANPTFDFTLADGALVGTDTKEGLDLTLTCAATNASGVGEYDVTGTATNTNYTVTVDGAKALTIEAKDLTAEMVDNIDGTFAYDGTAKEPAVTVTDTAATITASDYTVTYSNNTNAGDATATITGKGNYTGTVTKTFTINPLEATLTWSGAETRTYDGTNSNVTATVSNLKGNDQCTVTVTGGTAKDAGDYTATATALSNTNYTLPTAATAVTQDYTISPKTLESKDLEYKSGALTKVYDGTATASGIVVGVKAGVLASGDTLTIDGAAVYNSKDVKDATKIIFTPKAITEGNYRLAADQTLDIAGATITKKTLTITGVKATDRAYEQGRKSVDLNEPGDTTVELVGVVDGDKEKVSFNLPATGTIETPDSGARKDVSIETITLTGEAAANYTLTQPTVTVNIYDATTTIPVDVGTYRGADEIACPADATDAVSKAAEAIRGATDNTVNKIVIGDNAKDVMQEASNAAISDPKKVEAAIAEAKKSSETFEEAKSIKIAAVPFVQIQVKSATLDKNKASENAITLDITFMLKMEATIGNDVDALKSIGSATEIAVNKPITLTIPIPDDFEFKAVGETTAKTPYVKHIHDNKTYYYQGAYDNAYNNVTFTSRNGLSEFTILANLNVVATIERNGGTMYFATLQEAVNAVADGETIKLAADITKDTTATVSSAVNFTLDANGYTGIDKITITADSGYQLKKDGNTYTVTKKSSGGGGSSVTTAGISVAKTEDGTVTTDVTKAKAGSTVTITVAPDEGYGLETLTVTDASGKEVTVTKVSDTEYTFTMPKSKVSVDGSFVLTFFDDVERDDWFYDSVKYVFDNGIMNGTGKNLFSPDNSTTRAMIFTMLARVEGVDTTGSDPWYETGMNWAKEQGISDGTMPMNNVTREQLATMLYRYEVQKNGAADERADLTTFPDAGSVSAWAEDGMAWCVAEGIVNGKSGKLVPTGDATRAEVATMLMRYLELDK